MNARVEVADDHRESADSYRGEVIRDGSYRVAVCRDGIQWLFQRQDPEKPLAGARWRTLGYCRRRETLERLWREYAGRNAPDILAFLPERLIRS